MHHVRVENRLHSVRGLIVKTITKMYLTTMTEAAAVLTEIPSLNQTIYQHLDFKRHRNYIRVMRDQHVTLGWAQKQSYGKLASK